MSIRFPDVPFTTGVPPVFRQITTIAVEAILVAQLRQDALGGPGDRRIEWGVFDGLGNLAIEPDSIVDVEPQREFRISDYPIEAGGFESYNKVATPGTLRVTMTKGGTDTDRNTFLATLDMLLASLDPLNVITPETAFLDYIVTRVDYRRTAQAGAKLLTAEVMFQEIRQTATAKFTNSKSPSGADVVNAGPVQAGTPAVQQMPPQGVAASWI